MKYIKSVVVEAWKAYCTARFVIMAFCDISTFLDCLVNPRGDPNPNIPSILKSIPREVFKLINYIILTHFQFVYICLNNLLSFVKVNKISEYLKTP